MATEYWVRVRVHATGAETTWTFDTALGRGLALISAALYVDVLAQGETPKQDDLAAQ